MSKRIRPVPETVYEALLEVYKAYTVEGPAPLVHRRAIHKLGVEWPTLSRSLNKLRRTMRQWDNEEQQQQPTTS